MFWVLLGAADAGLRRRSQGMGTTRPGSWRPRFQAEDQNPNRPHHLPHCCTACAPALHALLCPARGPGHMGSGIHQGRHTEKIRPCGDEAEAKGHGCSQDAWSPAAGEAQRALPWGLQVECSPATSRSWSCGLQTVRQDTSVIQSPQVAVLHHSHPRKSEQRTSSLCLGRAMPASSYPAT